MVALRSFFASALVAFQLGASVYAKGLFESSSLVSRSPLQPRQAPVLTAVTCDTVDLAVTGNTALGVSVTIVVARDVCVCVSAGAITPASLTRIDTQIRANSGVLAPIINNVGGLTAAVTQAAATALPEVVQTGTTCNYPPNSVSSECGGCGYTCAIVNNVQYVRCGIYCVAPGTTCTSGIPSRKRDLPGSLNRCPTGFEACRIPGAPRHALGFECIDTSSDLEACGGCVTPFAGRPTGQDCSALPNVETAVCVRGGCEIQTCVKGFELQEDECVQSNGAKLLGYWEGLQAAVKVAAP